MERSRAVYGELICFPAPETLLVRIVDGEHPTSGIRPLSATRMTMPNLPAKTTPSAVNRSAQTWKALSILLLSSPLTRPPITLLVQGISL